MTQPTVCAILAKRRSGRFDTRTTGLPFGKSTFAERALAATAAFQTIIVADAGDTSLARSAERFGVRVIENTEPERGMAHALRLANVALGEPRAALAVLLIDTPLVDADVLIRLIAGAHNADVAHPVGPAGQAGNPILLGPHARRHLKDLPDGDTLPLLRDDPHFTHVRVAFTDDRPFVDLDSGGDLLRAGDAIARETYGVERSTNIASPKEKKR